MKSLIILAMTCGLSFQLTAQTCQFDIAQTGQAMEFEIKSWSNPHVADPKFQKMKASKKAGVIEDFISKIESGKIKPTVSTFKVDVRGIAGEGEENYMYTGAGASSFLAVCTNDSLRLYRNLGEKTPSATKPFYAYGVQTLPLKPQVGYIMKPYADIMVSVPEKTSVIVQEKVLQGFKKNVDIERFTTKLIDGKAVSGDFKTVSYDPQYSIIDHEMEMTLQPSMLVINYAESEVVEKTTFEINGTPYDAFIIESQKWMKGQQNVTFDYVNTELRDKQQKGFDRFQERIDKKVQRGLTKQGAAMTDDGYLITRIREWYVPGFGIVKLENIDFYGVKSMEMTLVSIK
ncbi:MAG: hypothetical protein ABJG41_00235 [Cyclobacteriaceae bacterium]